METLQFKTNIKCGGCITTVTPFLNGDQEIENWKVDLENPARILTVETTHSAQEVQDLVKKAGYNADVIA
jgi:copper chaperone CopZ